ncbi:MAG TPA: hypothetical protein VN947_33425 [Polyangia bacterium]|nr:hypothetical protein [Polyangia bacterium]
MGHVYGDSTTFPFDINFVELIRHAVECGVTLMAAQHSIATAVDRSGNFDQIRKQERARMDAMSDAIKLTMTAFMSSHSERMVRTASRVLESARAVIESELAMLEGQASGEISNTRATVERSRETTFRAVETFVLRHDLPNTSVGLRLLAGEESYSGQALVATPFGIEAVFSLAIPPAHDWGKIRRVAELSAGTEVHIPQESGWLSKRVAVAPVKLDKLVVTEVAMASDRSLITLRKGPRSGGGFQLEVTAEAQPKATMRRLGEDGSPTPDPVIELGGEDSMHAMRLWNRVVDSTHDLGMRRQSMTTATFDGKPLREIEDPAAIATKLINVLAPIVQEIARRSGAPGELVLRRDLGEGRREEIYITKAELNEKVLTLPTTLRPVFDPFELSEGPRSPRAPAPSEPIYIDADDVEGDNPDEEVTRNRT